MTLDYASIMMVKVIGEYNGSGLPVQPLRGDSGSITPEIHAKMLNPFGDSPMSTPKIGSTGVIIQRNKDDNVQAFWLGNIMSGDFKSSDEEVSMSKGDSKIAVNEEGLNIEHKNGGITQDSVGTKIKNNSNFIEVNNSSAVISISESDIPVALLEISPRDNKIINNGQTTILSENDIRLNSKKGRVIISGEYSKENEKYKPNMDFSVNTNNISMLANGGPVYIEGGKMTINLSDSKMSHSIPGMGGSTAFEMSIISGDIDISNKLGDIYINACNTSSIGVIQFKNGSLLSPTTIITHRS